MYSCWFAVGWQFWSYCSKLCGAKLHLHYAASLWWGVHFVVGPVRLGLVLEDKTHLGRRLSEFIWWLSTLQLGN